MTTSITGDAELRRKLNRLKDFSFLAPIIEAGGGEVMKYMQVYPRKPPQSTYTRTHRLEHGWNVEMSGLKATIGSNPVDPKSGTQYGPLVQAAASQTAVHARTGWQTDEMAVAEKKDKILDAIKKAVDKVLAQG